jgi:RNA polymerase sigma factor (sigma-70 family)
MDKEILIDLKGENNEAYGKLYLMYFGLVKNFIKKNSGTTSDAEDVFQEVLLVLFEKLKKDDFQLTASLKTYIFAISKNLWLKRLRTTSREVEFTASHSDLLFTELDSAIDEERTLYERLFFYFRKISKHCNRLLHDIFLKEKPIEQIQTEYGYTTKHNAVNQKHKCLNQIKKVKELDTSQ